ncbi:hypothetical protein HDV00_009795 [Rhizophlyctis rosea]|nr:hypothetical protein HDV00_009795 [Rhizophlyctis rosea]
MADIDVHALQTLVWKHEEDIKSLAEQLKGLEYDLWDWKLACCVTAFAFSAGAVWFYLDWKVHKKNEKLRLIQRELRKLERRNARITPNTPTHENVDVMHEEPVQTEEWFIAGEEQTHSSS